MVIKLWRVRLVYTSITASGADENGNLDELMKKKKNWLLIAPHPTALFIKQTNIQTKKLNAILLPFTRIGNILHSATFYPIRRKIAMVRLADSSRHTPVAWPRPDTNSRASWQGLNINNRAGWESGTSHLDMPKDRHGTWSDWRYRKWYIEAQALNFYHAVVTQSLMMKK